MWPTKKTDATLIVFILHSSPWDSGHIGIKLVTKHVIHQKLANFMWKRVMMLTGLKASSLACENWIVKVLKCRKEIYKGIELRVDEKNGLICLVIKYMVSKMSKNGSFFVFSAHGSKRIVTVWKKYLKATEGSYWVLSENIVNRLWSYSSWDIAGRNIRNTAESTKKILKPFTFKGWHLANGNSEFNNP